MSERPIEKIMEKCLHSSDDEQGHQLELWQEGFLEWELFYLCIILLIIQFILLFSYYFNSTEITSFDVNKKTLFSVRYVNITIKYHSFI